MHILQAYLKLFLSEKFHQFLFTAKLKEMNYPLL